MDIFKKYKKHKKISNFTIIAMSLVLAVAINFFVINSDWVTKNLKTSLLEAEIKQNSWDVFLEQSWEDIVLRSNNIIKNISNLNLSLVYNPENIEILEITPKLNSETSSESNTPWINTVIIEFNGNNDITSWEEIFRMKVSKKEDVTENINIVSANFTDISWEVYELQTKWITY